MKVGGFLIAALVLATPVAAASEPICVIDEGNDRVCVAEQEHAGSSSYSITYTKPIWVDLDESVAGNRVRAVLIVYHYDSEFDFGTFGSSDHSQLFVASALTVSDATGGYGGVAAYGHQSHSESNIFTAQETTYTFASAGAGYTPAGGSFVGAIVSQSQYYRESTSGGSCLWDDVRSQVGLGPFGQVVEERDLACAAPIPPVVQLVDPPILP